MTQESPSRTPRQIVRDTCEGTGISPEDAFGISRKPRIVEIRYRIVRALHHERGWGISRIGRFINRDHTTAYHGLNRPTRDLDSLPPLKPRKSRKTPVDLVPVIISAAPPAEYVPLPVFVEADPGSLDDSKPTRLQIACRAATDRLISEHGPSIYSRFNIAGERSQLRPPPFV